VQLPKPKEKIILRNKVVGKSLPFTKIPGAIPAPVFFIIFIFSCLRPKDIASQAAKTATQLSLLYHNAPQRHIILLAIKIKDQRNDLPYRLYDTQ